MSWARPRADDRVVVNDEDARFHPVASQVPWESARHDGVPRGPLDAQTAAESWPRDAA